MLLKSLLNKNWNLPDVDSEKSSCHAETLNIDEKIIKILHSRGIRTPEEIYSFLFPHYSDLYSPFQMEGIFPAIERLKRALHNNEKIGIFSDSDLDGITSLVVYLELFTRLKIKPYYRYLKDDEPYGITEQIIDDFHKNGVQLIITADSGIRDIDEIKYAGLLGIDIIVTDHHEQDEYLPDAIIINPKVNQCNYPFKELAGVGVAFKLCHAFLLSYLPSFNKNFLLFASSQKGMFMSKIKNGIVLDSISVSPDFDDKTVDTDDIIIVYNDKEFLQKIKEKRSENVYDFFEFARMCLPNRLISAEDISSHLGIDLTMYSITDLVNKLFIEMQFISSGKINSYIEDVLGFVSIGSIADVVLLRDENRTLVRYGIEHLNKSKHTGLSLLSRKSKFTSKSIGWELAPLLNSPGRIGKTDLTVSFFLEKDVDITQNYINKIQALNERRKTEINSLSNQYLEKIENNNVALNDKLLFIKAENINDGYAGLLANRISDTTGKPVIIAVFPGTEGIVKGSARSKRKINFFSFIEPFSDAFVRVGGHAQAFGFTIEDDKIDDIIMNINKQMENIDLDDEISELDLELDLIEIDLKFVKSLVILEPYGNGNPEPLFFTRSLCIDNFIEFGKTMGHGKYKFSDNPDIECIGWNMADKMKMLYEENRPVDIVYRLEINRFNGKEIPRIILADII